MASKVFEIRTDPHEAIIGGVTLLFTAETSGASFATAYSSLKEAQRAITDAGDNAGAAELTAVSNGMRAFVESFLLPDSLDAFDALKLPDRILIQLLEYVAELYSGKAGTSSSAS